MRLFDLAEGGGFRISLTYDSEMETGRTTATFSDEGQGAGKLAPEFE
jgi:hypothetical protein